MIEVLEKAARACGVVILEEKQRGLTATDKEDTLGAHFATQADARSQETAFRMLREAFPGEVLIGEEEAHEDAIPPNCSVVDPVDGTTPFFSGCREYGVTLCTLRDGQLSAGVMYFSEDQMMISAVRGRGCFINGRRVTLRWSRPVDKTMIGMDVWPQTPIVVLEPLARQFCIRSMMSAVWGARGILVGETGAYVNLGSKIWDAAAATLALQEAGGIACAPDGSPLQWKTIAVDWVLAANRELVDHVLAYTKLWNGRMA